MDIKNYVKIITVKIVLITLLLVILSLNFGIIKKIIKHLDNVLKIIIKNIGLTVVNVIIKYINH